MKKVFAILFVVIFSVITILFSVSTASAAGGIYASGGGTKNVGDTFNISVTASGATFDSLQGVISVTGPVTVVSVSAGSATWLPGKAPSNGGQFVGITSATASLLVATVKLKATAEGSGAVTVSGSRLALSGTEVGTGGGQAGYTIKKAVVAAGAVKVTSATHPDPSHSYEATTVELSWGKAADVTGFSYLLDDVADTVPPTKVTSADTKVSYPDQKVGTHYFHIRATNANGWGSTTNFQINIKEPDPKINDTLAKPSDIKIEKADNFNNNLDDGTVINFIISGKTLAGYKANLILNPLFILPEGKLLVSDADDNGNFKYLVDFPVKAGFYKLTVHGQKDKVLTPLSDEIKFELALAKGGGINILTSADATNTSTTQKSNSIINTYNVVIGLAIIVMIVLLITVIVKSRKNKRKQPSKSIDRNPEEVNS